VEVSILGGGEASGDCEGESSPSGREDDMLAVLCWCLVEFEQATWSAVVAVAYCCKGQRGCDWQARLGVTGGVEVEVVGGERGGKMDKKK
jgi:hypothetical protein